MKVLSLVVDGEIIESVIIFESEKEKNKNKYSRMKSALDKEFRDYLERGDRHGK